MVDASGRMIGLNVAYVNSRGISIPINSVESTITALVRDGKTRTAHLGISADAINLPKRLANEAKHEEGLLVLKVENGSPAKRVGLVVGDILLTFNNAPITSLDDLYRLLTRDTIGKTVELGILRAEKVVKLTITPAENVDE